MLLNISEPLTQEVLNKFIAKVNENTNYSHITDIYLSGDGGEVGIMEAILHIINRKPGSFTITGYGSLASSTFELFFKAKCQKSLIYGTVGMLHQSAMPYTVNENMKAPARDRAYNDCVEKYMGIAKINTELFMKNIGLYEKEIEEINNGEDVWFDPNRMMRILEESRKTYYHETVRS